LSTALRLRFFLDEGVPDGVGGKLAAAGHDATRLRDAGPTGASDELVCALAEARGAILVALDGDMRALARRHGVGRRRYRALGLVKLSCRETRAAARVVEALSLVEHEWSVGALRSDRRIFIEIGDAVISTWR
jgi:predicted nuclease of predicted toxin-antitoxin system